MENVSGSVREWLTHSAFLRVIFISFVILLLHIPIGMINSQVSERQVTKQQAINDVTAKWGHAQNIDGPRLVIPYYEISSWKNNEGELEQSRTKHFATFLPESLTVNARVDNEVRYRGIFEIPLYKTEVNLHGRFRKPDFGHWGIDPELILWNQAELAIGVSDPRGIRRQAYVHWNARKLAFEPGPGKSGNHRPGFHATLGDAFTEESFEYNIDLALNGSQHVYFSPVGKESTIHLESDWPDPSFQGYKLPTQRTVTSQGFKAQWNISSISRGYPQYWLQHQFDMNKFAGSRVGVDFISPVDSYRMTERSIKYVMLFLLFTFVAIWLVEVITRLRVHLLQYLLVGLGMSLFYLLLLALSEHIGFSWAYVTASVAVVVMIGLYSRVVLQSGKRAMFMGGGISALYVYLFTLLQEQSYALLFGAVGIFFTLAAVMYLTRHIDWYKTGYKAQSD